MVYSRNAANPTIQAAGTSGIDDFEDRLTVRHLYTDLVEAGLPGDVRLGLSEVPKWLPPKYFYDARGSRLFEQICDTPEYYPTRVELGLLSRIAGDVIEYCDTDCLVELGSGSSRKTDLLLAQAGHRHAVVRYVPIDVCREAVIEASHRLLQHYADLSVDGIIGDYETGLTAVPEHSGRRLFMFLGGSIGNFDEPDAVAIITAVADAMDTRDWFLLGVDRVKDEVVLNAAYNDAQGITAKFNLNVLRVINRELDGDFDLSAFEHHAYYNAPKARIEMHLRSLREQSVRIGALPLRVEFRRGETILTEISRKFTVDSVTELCEAAGLLVARHYQPENQYFSLVLARKR